MHLNTGNRVHPVMSCAPPSRVMLNVLVRDVRSVDRVSRDREPKVQQNRQFPTTNEQEVLQKYAADRTSQCEGRCRRNVRDFKDDGRSEYEDYDIEDRENVGMPKRIPKAFQPDYTRDSEWDRRKNSDVDVSVEGNVDDLYADADIQDLPRNEHDSDGSDASSSDMEGG